MQRRLGEVVWDKALEARWLISAGWLGLNIATMNVTHYTQVLRPKRSNRTRDQLQHVAEPSAGYGQPITGAHILLLHSQNQQLVAHKPPERRTMKEQEHLLRFPISNPMYLRILLYLFRAQLFSWVRCPPLFERSARRRAQALEMRHREILRERAHERVRNIPVTGACTVFRGAEE